jgi:Tol biopolymer transport system component
VGAGVWSQSGKYFFYETRYRWSFAIWVVRNALFPLRKRSKPESLTAGGPGIWSSPLASPDDENTILAINHYKRPELVRLDPVFRAWQPEWLGASAFELAYSVDCQWAAYTKLPDHSIWKARRDGSERVQLVPGGKEAHQPHWSPDGSHIAYMGKNSQDQWAIFATPSASGPAEQLTTGDESGVPTWSADGRSLIFGERLTKKPRSEMTIRMLDLASKRVTEMPGSRGLWSPRWSPDGKHILALSTDSKVLRVRTIAETDWKDLARLQWIDNATWSADSRDIYFNAAHEDNHRWMFRYHLATNRLEPVVELDDFAAPSESWFGVDADGNPLAVREARVDDIFKLKCALP